MKGVDYVFHAAALKQVPSCEFYPMEAVRTNVLGAENVMNAAIASGVKRRGRAEHGQGGLSDQCHGDFQGDDGEADGRQGTHARDGRDGASARPVTAMSWPRAVRSFRFSCRQLKEGKPLTVTDPNMTRFLMSLGGFGGSGAVCL